MQLTSAEITALQAACNAVIPSLTDDSPTSDFWRRPASDMPIPELIAETIGMLRRDEISEFRQLLFLLQSRFLGLTWLGPLKPITALTDAQREKMMQRWAASPLPDLRKAFQTIKKLTCFIFYSYTDGDTPNPNWSHIQYPGPLSTPPDLPHPILPLSVAECQSLSCEVLVIGSGAGGGVVAGELAEAGMDVLIVEKGPYLAEGDFNQKELDMIGTLYDSRGALVTRDGGVTVFAGSCLGGGTTVNWAGSFSTPDYILDAWKRKHGVEHFASSSYRDSMDAVEAAIGVTTAESPHNAQNQALVDGAASLNRHTRLIPRNCHGCMEDHCRSCGYCGFGCQRGSKQSMLKNYLQRAWEQDARFLVNTEVKKILQRNGEAIGVEALINIPGEIPQKITIHARKVVVAAGSIHTPALLLRSGIRHRELGRNLFFHPTLAVSALYNQPVNSWWGGMMTAVCDDFTRLDGDYGFKLETPPVHPGTIGLALPWLSGRQHKEDMLKASRFAHFIVLTRDRDGGRVSIDRDGRAVLQYSLSSYDRMHMLRGIAEAARIHLAAGATSILLPHNSRPEFSVGNGASAESFLGQINALRWSKNKFPLFSAHQMSTCRMGGNAETHPVDPAGRLRALRNVYIADASAFPECSGANPMISIQAMAHYTAQQIKANISVSA